MHTLDPKLPGLAQEANEAHAEAQASFRSGVEHAVRAGRALAKAKARLAHGRWASWLAENFQGSERLAQLYMRLARRLPELDDETRNAVAEMSLREASREIAEPRTIRVRHHVQPAQALLVRISQIDAKPPAHPCQTEQPTRVTVAALPSPRSGTVAAFAKTVPFDRGLIIPHLAALIDLSSAASPGEFAAALASKSAVSAADLKQLVSWLASSARELERIATAQK